MFRAGVGAPRQAVERGGKARRVAGTDAGHLPAGQDDPSDNPRNAERTRRAPDAGCPFFWFVFFGQTKKMNSPSGETGARRARYPPEAKPPPPDGQTSVITQSLQL